MADQVDLMGQPKKAVIPRSAVKRPAGAEFIMQSNKAPIKPIRFPKLTEELKNKEKERNLQEKERKKLDLQGETMHFADTLPSNLVAYLESG